MQSIARFALQPTAVETMIGLEVADDGFNGLTPAEGETVDEATSVKTPSSSLHKAVKKFVGKDNDQSNGLVLMTGSPIENKLTDAYGLISLLTPARYGSYRSFERMHCILSYGQFPKVVGFMNEDYAYESLYLRGRRVLKKDVSDLPP